MNANEGCPTCGHTMAKLCVSQQGDSHFHCERCGTVVVETGDTIDPRDVYVPKLVERCREYEGEFDKENIAQFYRNTWNRLGIRESIHSPEDRP